jgi:hypothetical protein
MVLAPKTIFVIKFYLFFTAVERLFSEDASLSGEPIVMNLLWEGPMKIQLLGV